MSRWVAVISIFGLLASSAEAQLVIDEDFMTPIQIEKIEQAVAWLEQEFPELTPSVRTRILRVPLPSTILAAVSISRGEIEIGDSFLEKNTASMRSILGHELKHLALIEQGLYPETTCLEVRQELMAYAWEIRYRYRTRTQGSMWGSTRYWYRRYYRQGQRYCKGALLGLPLPR